MTQRLGYLLGTLPIIVTVALVGGNAAYAQAANSVRVIRSTQSEILLEVTPNATYTRLAGGDILPRIPSAMIVNVGQTGEPIHPRISIPVALPGPDGGSLEIISSAYESPVQGRIAPVPSLKTLPDGTTTENYDLHRDGYAAGNSAPVASLRYMGVSRDLHVGSVDVEPVAYDPASGTVRFLRSITIRVRYASIGAGLRSGQPLSLLTSNSVINADAARTWGVAPGTRPTAYRRAATSSARAWFRVGVKEAGLYGLTSDDFKKVGIDLATLDPGQIAIYGGDGGDMPERVSMADSNRMHQVPTMIERGGDGRISQVVFYGTGPVKWGFTGNDTVPIHSTSPFVSANNYIVAVGGDPTLDFPAQKQPVDGAVATITAASASLVYDEDKVNAISTDYISGSGRGWFSTIFIADGSGSDTRPFPMALPGLDRSAQVIYRVRVAHSGRNSCPNCNDGQGFFSFSQDQTSLGNPIEISARIQDETVALAASRVYVGDASAIPSDNTSVLKIGYRSQVQAKGLLDYFEIHYRRRLSLEGADKDQIFFESVNGNGVAEYHVAGFGGDDLVGFDVTDQSNPVMLTPVSTGGGMFVFRDNMTAKGGGRRYFVTRRGNLKRSDDIAPVAFGDLRTRMQNADILVITHSDFRDAAQKYVDYRNGQKRFSATYVTTEEIYTEFSHGNLDPTALRDYIAYAFHNWGTKPSFVLLLGDGTYDYRNLSSQQKQLVPTYETEDGDVYNTISSAGFDDYYVRVVGNDPLLDLAVGRLPVETPEQASVVVDKIKRYESRKNSGTWRQTVLLAADDAYPSGGGDDFVRQSEELWRMLPTWLEPRKIYESFYPTLPSATGTKPGASQDLLDGINRGAVVTNWVGHGNPDVWAHETILQKDQFVPRCYNDSMLTYVIAVTCNFGHFDNPNKISGGEMFVLNPNGGAIAVMTASRAVWISANEYLMDAYAKQLFRRDSVTHRFPTIGQALFAVKQISNSDNDEKYMVFGDPAVYLDLPQDSVQIQEVNHVQVATDTATVSALSVVNVRGRVVDQFGNLDNNFNGTAIVELFDADRNVSVTELGASQNGTLYGGRLFRGPATVVNGQFTAQFRVPKDIAYDSATARMHVYAYNETEDAAGATSHIRVYGTDTATVTDTHGPELHLYLDDRSFRSGDMVTPTPLLIVDLADSSGINSSGSGLGHHIEAWLDGSARSIDLSDNYQTLPTDYGKGSAERRLLDLTPGEHQIRVRGWDIFNNPAEGTAYFRIGEHADSVLEVEQVVNYPNPMSRETDFTFLHNQTKPLDVEIAIYTLSGRKVRQLESRGAADRFVRVHWDGTDSDGELLANGVYLYRLKVKIAGDESGNDFQVIDKIAIVR